MNATLARRLRPAIAAVWLIVFVAQPEAAAPTAAAPDADIAVHVTMSGPLVVVDVELPVDATALEAWNVMTDYDRMARFVSNLESSSIVSRDGDTLIVAQKGKASRGPFTFAFENVRRVVLTPYSEIRSHLISGNLESSEFVTRVLDHGSSAQILNHGEY